MSFIHGMSKRNGKAHPIYNSWSSMKDRCNNHNSQAYGNYGGRGISVCKEWNDSFENFLKWAIESGYNEGMTLDRIDNNKGYSPENCRWATKFQQGRNKRNNHLITYNGKTQCIAAWSEETGIRRDTLLYRINHFKSIEDVFYPRNRRTDKCLNHA